VAIAIFDYGQWSALFPELVANVNEARATLLFNEAGAFGFIDNTDCSIITDPVRRLSLLNYFVAHLATLGGALEAGGVPTGLVGRISGASEGTVSVRTDMKAASSELAQFLQQTPYGNLLWAMLLPFRMGRYVPARQRRFDPVNLGYSPWR
jgi:hypothetical protein